MTDITTQDALRDKLDIYYAMARGNGDKNTWQQGIMHSVEAYKDNACNELLDSTEIVFLIGCIDVYQEHFRDSDSQVKWENKLSAKLQTMRNNLTKNKES
jgi:hypothetical protein